MVAVNVEPTLNLVGVRIDGDSARGYGGAAYVYPVRSGTDCIYLEPGQLAMFMTPQIRRVAVMLSPINLMERVVVRYVAGQVPLNDRAAAMGFLSAESQIVCRFLAVHEQDNVVMLVTDTGSRTVIHPLDRVLSVYQDDDWILLSDRI